MAEKDPAVDKAMIFLSIVVITYYLIIGLLYRAKSSKAATISAYVLIVLGIIFWGYQIFFIYAFVDDPNSTEFLKVIWVPALFLITNLTILGAFIMRKTKKNGK